MNEQERRKVCTKHDAYACLKSGCEYAEANDSVFYCHKPKAEDTP